MTTTHTAAPAMPTRAQFIRDRLAEYCDGVGWTADPVPAADLARRGRGQFCAALAVSDPLGDYVVTVDTLGDMREDDGVRMTLRGFAWTAEPTDTKRWHGPCASEADHRHMMRIRLAAA